MSHCPARLIHAHALHSATGIPTSLASDAGFSAGPRPLMLLSCFLLFFGPLAPSASAQRATMEAEYTARGVVRDRSAGSLTLVDDQGKASRLRIQNRGDSPIILGGKPYRVPATISVTGDLPVELIEPGMVARVDVETNRRGKTAGEVATIAILNGDELKLDHKFDTVPEKSDFAACTITGRVVEFKNDRLSLSIPDSDLNRKQLVRMKVKPDCRMKITDSDLDRVKRGDTVLRAVVIEISTGDLVVREIEIKLTAERQKIAQSFNDQLDQKFASLSDEPGQPRELRSKNFVLYTDISDRSSSILLAKLETMHELVGGYFRSAPRQPIVCFVVRDLSLWPAGRLKPEGAAKIAAKAGVTVWMKNVARKQIAAEVYSCDDHDIVQHEAVHAFCALTFGSTGPVWYGEGMAEMGQYWKPGQKAVDIDTLVIGYLQSSEPKKMSSIVAAGQITGDSWQAYAWRWALCHLLANNPNYSDRFKKLGLNMMSGGRESFHSAFGEVADHISFEYDQFVQNFGNGYRADLCAWDWSVKASKLSGSKRLKQDVRAQAGWQPTQIFANKSASYDYVCEGNWKIGEGTGELTADGNDAGEGRLIGVLVNDFKISDPFELGKKGTWVSAGEGQLYVRCRDHWSELTDNSGEVLVHFRRSAK